MVAHRRVTHLFMRIDSIDVCQLRFDGCDLVLRTDAAVHHFLLIYLFILFI